MKLVVLAALIAATSGCAGANLRPAPPPPALPGDAVAAPRVRPAAPAERPKLADRLRSLDDAKVTETLIELAGDLRAPAAERAEARALLARRRTGADAMLAALSKGQELDTHSRLPVGPLADALAAMQEPRAAPLLAHQLNDPVNSPEDIEHAARALSELATADEASELELFFSLYNATADDEALVRAVVTVAEVLMRVGGESGRALVGRAVADPLTVPEVRRGLENVTSLADLETGK